MTDHDIRFRVRLTAREATDLKRAFRNMGADDPADITGNLRTIARNLLRKTINNVEQAAGLLGTPAVAAVKKKRPAKKP